jgi:tetratricopeptide (TPR) repeat protein
MQKILAIDDSTSLVSPWKAEVMKDYKLINCVGWFEAQARMRENPDIRLVIINLSIPHINGADAVAKIRQKNSSIPIIVLAKPEDAKLVQAVKAYNIQEHESVPVDVNFLMHKIRKYAPQEIPAQEPSPESASQTKAAAPQREALNGDDIKGKYYTAQSLMANNDYQGAIQIYADIINEKKLKDIYLKYQEEAMFQTGRCYMKLEDFPKAVEAFKTFVTKAPKNMLTRQAIFHIGQAYECQNDPVKAINYYSKVLSLSSTDSLATQARKQIAKLQGK